MILFIFLIFLSYLWTFLLIYEIFRNWWQFLKFIIFLKSRWTFSKLMNNLFDIHDFFKINDSFWKFVIFLKKLKGASDRTNFAGPWAARGARERWLIFLTRKAGTLDGPVQPRGRLRPRFLKASNDWYIRKTVRFWIQWLSQIILWAWEII